MNTSLLTDKNFVQKMKEKLKEWIKEVDEFSDKRVACDWIKYNVHLFSINYSKELAKNKNGERRKNAKKLKNCKNTI